MTSGDKMCRFCHWLYREDLNRDDKTKEARAEGYCSWPCKIAYEAEKEYIIRRTMPS